MEAMISATNILKGVTFAKLLFSLVFSIFGVLLNSLEIFIIQRKWKSITIFEIILLNLAIADLLALTTSGGVVAVMIYYARNQYGVHFKTLTMFYIMIIFSVLSSVIFIIVIAVERLIAIKIPLKHRAWHSSPGRLTRCLIIIWGSLITVTGITITLVSAFVKGNLKTVSLTIRYFIGGYLTLGFIVAVILYSWIAYLLLKRHSKFLEYDPKDAADKFRIIKAMQKEKASIVVCVLAVVSFVGLNASYVIQSFEGKRGITMDSTILMITNSVVNPLIYFFKGYAEKYFKKKKIDFEPTQRKRCEGKDNDGHTIEP